MRGTMPDLFDPRAGPIDIEEQRRLEETRNERTVQRLMRLNLAIFFVLHALNWRLELLPFPTPPALLAWIALGIVVSGGINAYLQRHPTYRKERKYVLTLWEVVFYSSGMFMVAVNLPEPFRNFSGFLPMPVFIVLIVLSSLRYSPGAVLASGLTGIALQSGWALYCLPTRVAFAVMLGCMTYQGTVMAVTTVVVSSLLRLQREWVVKRRLQRFLAPELVEEVIQNPALLTRQVRRLEATVMFVDVRGFTAMSEQLPPEQVVESLNGFLEEATRAITDQQGMVDKYIGDSVMALFGVVNREDQVGRALAAALDLRQRMAAFNRRLAADGRPCLGFGVGIHTGPLVVGAIGSSRRFDYTAIGDTVNVAARIEGLTRAYGVDILLTEQARSRLLRDP
ncbi:MAG: adenylate/guanylate cyclase domain-containing protein, partial [Candidatus Eremiobacterota bacterium]